MASPSSLSVTFYTHSLSRPICKTGNPRKPLHKKLPKSSPRKKQPFSFNGLSAAQPLSTPSGVEATTYTRLPPREDFSLPPSHSAAQALVVKLADSEIANRDKKSNKQIIVKDDDVIDENSNTEFDYGKFELFEVNSDDEGQNDDSDHEDKLGLGLGLGFQYVFDGDTTGVEEVKEKGVPAVMRCFDRAKIFVKAGDGGNGVVAFRREKFVPFGGPSGGDGGRGGNVYVEVDGSMNSLLPFRQAIHFRAGRGSHGQGSKMNGAKGENVVVKVAPGTVVRATGKDGATGEVLMELLYPGQKAMLMPGGKGGRGNASFKSGTNKVPRIAEIGEEGAEM